MLGIDVGDRHQQRHQRPQEHHHLRREHPPHQPEQYGCQNLHRDVAERDRCLAKRAFCPQKKPAHHRHVLPQAQLVFAQWAERAGRLVHRHPKREPVDHHVQKRPDTSPNHHRRDQPNPMVQRRMDHRHSRHLSISRFTFSTDGAPIFVRAASAVLKEKTDFISSV